MTIYNTAIEQQLSDKDATELKDAALIALKALYKVKLTILAAIKECELGDWLPAAEMISKTIDEAHTDIDELFEIGKPDMFASGQSMGHNLSDLEQENNPSLHNGY